MNPIEERELSAYLDGELDAGRAAQVEAALTGDPQLAAQLQALRAADEAWQAAASKAGFAPAVRLPGATMFAESWIGIAIASILLAALRLLPGVTGLLDWSLAIHAAALVLVLSWTARNVTDAGGEVSSRAPAPRRGGSRPSE